jgi:hypothetical protein
MIERALAVQVDGDVTIEYAPMGYPAGSTHPWLQSRKARTAEAARACCPPLPLRLVPEAAMRRTAGDHTVLAQIQPRAAS